MCRFEQQHVGPELPRQPHRVAPVTGVADDVKLRITVEQLAQGLPEERVIVRDIRHCNGPDARACPTPAERHPRATATPRSQRESAHTSPFDW